MAKRIEGFRGNCYIGFNYRRGLLYYRSHDIHSNLSFPAPTNDEWQPPTAAELKVLQAKRERSDKISKIMGDYLLKGYKMLSTSCSNCGNILLRDKREVDYCIACSELESDAIKDDPALSADAARTQAAEQRQRTEDSSEDNWQVPDQQARLNTAQHQPHSHTTGAIASDLSDRQCVCGSVSDLIPTRSVQLPLQQGALRAPLKTQTSGPYESLNREECSETVRVLKNKIDWATGELGKSCSCEYDIQLCCLIKRSAEAIAALNAASISL